MSNVVMKKTYPESTFVKIKFNRNYSRESIEAERVVLQILPLSDNEAIVEIISSHEYKGIINNPKGSV